MNRELKCDTYINVYDFQELEESFNYGLFMPPSNGKAGKFLDEERRLSEYALPGPIGYLEVSSCFKLMLRSRYRMKFLYEVILITTFEVELAEFWAVIR